MKPTNRCPALLFLLATCGDPDPDPALGRELSIDVCSHTGTFSPSITTPFFPMPVG